MMPNATYNIFIINKRIFSSFTTAFKFFSIKASRDETYWVSDVNNEQASLPVFKIRQPSSAILIMEAQ